MTDIAVIILVGREEIHIRRCLEKLAPLNPRQIFVVESQEGDRTHEIAVETGRTLEWNVVVGDQLLVAGDGENHGEKIQPTTNHQQPTTNNQQPTTTLHTVFRTWPGNQATQFDWALDNLPVKSTWVLRLDADEYLTDDTIVKLRERFDFANHQPSVATNNQEPSLYTLELRHIFMGGEIRHGTAGIRIPRLFRLGHARYGGAIMDERLKTDGVQADFDGQFFDDNLNSFGWWQEKHRGYAKREAEQALAGHFHDPRKAKYYRLPPYLRAFLYFCIRYFLKLGFLDGIAGFRWHFWQGLWYRCLVDREIRQMLKSRPRSSRSSE